jgi:hypothetical protein
MINTVCLILNFKQLNLHLNFTVEHLILMSGFYMCLWGMQVPYFLAYKTYRPTRRTVIFSLEILEKNNECILILVIYWKKTGLLHIMLH